MRKPVIVHEDDREWETWREAEASGRGRIFWKTLISAHVTTSDTLTLGVAKLAPGEALHEHRHEQAEVYFLLEGLCTVTIDGDARVVGRGSAVFIPGNALHSCRNTGADEAEFVYVIAADSFDDVEYVFSE